MCLCWNCRAKPVYMGGQLVYTVGMICMATSRSKLGVIIFSWTAGIMYSTLFTMPYLLVAHYHASQIVGSFSLSLSLSFSTHILILILIWILILILIGMISLFDYNLNSDKC